jgi:sec-independent protein translocase protein TatB
VFGALDPAKILMILVVALIVLGPERLPKAARQLGSYWRTLIQLRGKLEEEFHNAVPDFKEAFPDVDLPRIPKNPRAAVSSFVTSLITPDEPSPSEPAAELPAGDEAVAGADAGVHGDQVTTGSAGSAGRASGDEPHVPEEELASVTAAWQAAVDSPNGSTNGSSSREPNPEVEQRSKHEFAPFIDDPTMN